MTTPVAQAQARATATRPDQRPAEPVGTRGRASARPQAPATAPAEPQEAADAPDPSRITDIRGLEPQPRDPADTVDDGEPDPDVGDGAERIASRRPQDGDLRERPATVVQDGTITPEQPQMPVDGDLALVEELADQEAGEELADDMRPGRPITPRRYGPYQPVGMRVGSFILFPEIETGIAASDNLFKRPTERKSDTWAEIRPGARLESNWRRHALEMRVQGLRSYHLEYDKEDDRRLEAQLRGRLDVSRRTNLAGELAYTFGQEGRGAINVPSAQVDRPNVITRRAAAEVNHRINRVALQLRGAVAENEYSAHEFTDPVTGASVVPFTRDRNYTQREVATRVGYEINPGFIAFVDTAFNDRRHEAANQSDGILRDSEGSRVRAGAQLNIRGSLQGEASIGFGRQTPDDRRLREIAGWIFDAALAWQPTGLTEVRISARSDISETTLAGSGGAMTRTAAIDVRHALQRHIILIAGLSYAVADYGGSTLNEREARGRLGLEYYLSRRTAVVAGYEHTRFEANQPGRDYQDNTVRVGMKVRQ